MIFVRFRVTDMPAQYVVHLEAETGKAFVLPFSNLDSLREYGHIQKFCIYNPNLLPEPFRLFCDGYAKCDGKGINFIASFYIGLHSQRIIFGDVYVCKTKANEISGLSLEEVQFLSLDLERGFGIRLPAFASA